MLTSHQNAISPSVSAFACAMGHRGLPVPLDDVDQLLAASATLIDVHDASSALSPSASCSDGGLKDATRDYDVPTFGMVQLKSGLVWLHQLVIALFVQITTVASDVVSLKDRVTAVESTPPVVRDPVTEALARQVNELCERVTSLQDRIASLENSHHAETDAYKKTIQELTTKIDDELKTRDDAIEKLGESFRLYKISMETQGARITAVKADFALKIRFLQKDMVGVQTELSTIKKAAPPADAPSASQVTKEEAPKAQILTSVAQPGEEEVDDIVNYPLLPAVARILAYAAVARELSADTTSSGGQSIVTPNQNETKVKIPKKSPAAARTNVDLPGANKISAIPTMPRAMERLMPARGINKENKPCNSSTTRMTQEDKMSKPSAGQSPDVSLKLSSMASPRKAQSSTGSASKISALPKPRKSLLPAPRKSFLPCLAKPGAVADGGQSKEVKTADRLPGGSETQTKKPITSKIAAIVKLRPSSESTSSRVVEKEAAAGLPASSSLEPLDGALRAMQADGNDLLRLEPPFSCSIDDLSFSEIAPIPPTKWRVRNENIQAPFKPRSMDVRPPKSPLRSTLVPLAGNETSPPLPTSSSLAALDAAVQKFQGDGDILTFVPVPGVDFTFSTRRPVFRGARPPHKRESIYVSPVRASAVKPSRRL